MFIEVLPIFNEVYCLFLMICISFPFCCNELCFTCVKFIHRSLYVGKYASVGIFILLLLIAETRLKTLGLLARINLKKCRDWSIQHASL